MRLPSPLSPLPACTRCNTRVRISGAKLSQSDLISISVTSSSRQSILEDSNPHKHCNILAYSQASSKSLDSRVCLSVYLSLSVSWLLSLCLSVCLSVDLLASVSVSVSFSLDTTTTTREEEEKLHTCRKAQAAHLIASRLYFIRQVQTNNSYKS